ncbi:hypothetical protein chiPu_0003184 [Chiloscyllium punctatum]|uniref:Peptidase S53 domain-containing protein n=1 Tax=Chiloscyllium punctatum TaxID=137246 RepID=A0A401S332_CHIPU|nr:hypothetical protein [Chiloscyllium punctatum]
MASGRCSFVVFCVCSAVISSSHGVYLEPDQNVSLPNGWIHVGRVSASDEVLLTFSLKQQNTDKLKELLEQVSNPHSIQYGKYLTLDELSNLIRPSEETLKTVWTWLKNHDVQNCSTIQTLDFLRCFMSASTAEKLLPGSEFNRYTNGRHILIRSPVKYEVAEEVAEHIDFVGGVHRFPQKKTVISKAWKASQNIEADFHLGVTPAVLRKRYNLTASAVGSHENSSQAVAQFLEQYFHQMDLSEFMTLFGSSFVHHNKVSKVIGSQGGIKAGLEASLDVEYIMSAGANITTWVFSNTGRHESQEPFLDWMMLLSNMSSIPWVHSVSYGDDEDSLSLAYLDRINIEFMKSGVRGLTLLFASATYYNVSGRAYPDVAALSDNYWIVSNLIPIPWISGTSASTPVFSGILALINDRRFQKGLPALGFVNPLLYSLQEKGITGAFFDVTTGCQLGCLDEKVEGQGFCASQSWDPVTGWGTPNYPELLKAFLAGKLADP